MTDKPNYKHLIEAFTKERIEERAQYLYLACKEAINRHELGDLLRGGQIGISQSAIHVAIVNYFSDISRLKDFHSIIYSFLVFTRTFHFRSE